MTIEDVKKFKEYFYNEIADFDESTILTPNMNGEKEAGKLNKATLEIKKEGLNDFLENNEISLNVLCLGSAILTLNKFNFTAETLIYYGNNIPFASKFEDRTISIKDYLDEIGKIYEETLSFNNCSSQDLLYKSNLKAEFYYNYNNDLESVVSKSELTNCLNVIEEDERIILSFLFNDQMYSEEYIETFLKNVVYSIV